MFSFDGALDELEINNFIEFRKIIILINLGGEHNTRRGWLWILRATPVQQNWGGFF